MKYFWVIGILVCSFLLPLSAAAFDDDDFQCWSINQVSWGLTEDWSAALTEELYFGDNARDFYYHHTDLGFGYSGLADWFKVSFNYRQIFVQNNQAWYQENRPHRMTELQSG